MYLRTGRTAAAGRRPTAPMAIASSLGALPSRSSLVRSSTSRLGLLPQPPRFLSSTSRLGGLPPPDTTTVLRQPNGAPLYVVAPPRESFRQRVHRAFRKQIAASMRAAFILAGGLGGWYALDWYWGKSTSVGEREGERQTQSNAYELGIVLEF